MTSERAMILASASPVSPAAPARSLVAALLPSGSHSTRCPAPARHFPTAAPISPGCSSPIVVSPMPSISPGAELIRTQGLLVAQRREPVPADHPDPVTARRGNRADEDLARGI